MEFRYFSQGKEISTLVVPGSLLLGVCWLIGTCWALGLNSFGFISVADVVRSALFACPVMVALLVGYSLLFEAFPKLKTLHNKSGFSNPLRQSSYRLSVLLAVFTFTVGYVMLTSSAFYTMVLYWGAGVFYLIYKLTLPRDKSGFSLIIVLLGAVTNICFIFALAAFSMTGLFMSYAFEKPRESICLANGCRDGTVIKRFSDATYILWRDDKNLSIVINSEVKSITGKQDISGEPIFESRQHLKNIWSWLTTTPSTQ